MWKCKTGWGKNSFIQNSCFPFFSLLVNLLLRASFVLLPYHCFIIERNIFIEYSYFFPENNCSSPDLKTLNFFQNLIVVFQWFFSFINVSYLKFFFLILYRLQFKHFLRKLIVLFLFFFRLKFFSLFSCCISLFMLEQLQKNLY